MNLKKLSERDICSKFITPVMAEAGWCLQTQIREEFSLTKGRKITEADWKISAEKLTEGDYNFDSKNPHQVEVHHGDPKELMTEYLGMVEQLKQVQQALKSELITCLGSTN